MDSFVEMKIEAANENGLLRYRVTLDLGQEDANPQGTEHSIEEAVRSAFEKATAE